MTEQAGFTTIRVRRRSARTLKQLAPDGVTYADALEALIGRRTASKLETEAADALSIDLMNRKILIAVSVLVASLGDNGSSILAGMMISFAVVLFFYAVGAFRIQAIRRELRPHGPS